MKSYHKKYKMKKILTSALLISLLVVSCKKEETEPETTDTTTESNIIIPVASAETPTSAQEVQATEPNMMMQNNNAGAINPAHGQPGHRCEIPVGAPLSTAPKEANVSKPVPTNTAPVNVPQLGATNANAAQNANANQVTPPGMNPPHGQPGHTCSVAVGAPLPTN